MRPLPEKYRAAWRIDESYEVATHDGWFMVVKTLRIYSPANIVRLELADGSAVILHPTDEIMSRRVGKL